MSGAGEAVTLPMLFLTVAMLGGVRVADRVTLLPPPLFTLVLALMLLGVLVRSGALAPDRLTSASRPALANANGLVVLVTMSCAEAGLPRLLCNLFLLVLLVNTLAASPDRVRVLRSLMVVFGSAFTLKFIVLAALSDPAGGMVKRALLAILEGLTLGTLTQATFHPLTGYLAFFTLLLFLIGLALLPSRDRQSAVIERLPTLRE